MNGSGSEGGGFDIFRWVMGISGTIIGAITLAGGRTLIAHDREIGELKTGKIATDDQVSQLRVQIEKVDERFNRVDDKLDKIRESIERIAEVR